MGQSSHSLDGQLLHRSILFVEMSCDWPPPSAYRNLCDAQINECVGCTATPSSRRRVDGVEVNAP